jgi:hypothetical protein
LCNKNVRYVFFFKWKILNFTKFSKKKKN